MWGSGGDAAGLLLLAVPIDPGSARRTAGGGSNRDDAGTDAGGLPDRFGAGLPTEPAVVDRHAGIFSLLGTGSRTAGQTAWPSPGGLARQRAESEAEISGPGNLLFSYRWGDDPGLAGCQPTLSELA